MWVSSMQENFEESIKIITGNEENNSSSSENISLPTWDINPPFELLDRSE